MAGHGPPPAKQKRRTNSTEVSAVEHEPFETPALPATYVAVEWIKGAPVRRRLKYTPQTRAWWEAWGRSPLAAEFAEVHWHRLLALAKLKDRFERDPSPANATELRLQEAAFGGSPADARRLGHTVKHKAPASPSAPGTVTDLTTERRRRLTTG